MASSFTLVLDLAAVMAFISFVVAFDQRRKRKGLRYPPGPRALPIVGNLFDVPKEFSWLTYAGWGKTYGDIISIQVFGQVIVILNSATVARDLLEKRGTIYSGRPTIHFWELMNWSWFEMSTTYSEKWRLRRKMLDQGLRPSAAVLYRPMQKEKAHDLLKQLLSRPEEFRNHIEYLQGAIIMSLVYGYDLVGEDDLYLRTALDTNAISTRTLLPGSVIVNDLPFLKHLPEWLPGMGFKALARKGDKLGQDMVNLPFDLVKENMRHGAARLSVTRENLLELEHDHGVDAKETERAIAEASGSLYLAGADTTVSAISTLFLVLVLYPDIQRRAQAELDAVTEGKRLPDFEDRPRLPYVEALCKEVLRWRCVAPVGVPHSTMEDNVYNGYFIPKGATVIANIWAILQDSRVYTEPGAFKPERFLTPEGKVRDDPTLMAVWGFGRRICPGRHIAENTLFIVAAAFLATFTIGKAKDAHGSEIPVECAYTGAVLTYPKEFDCSIVPRSQKAEELISMESWETGTDH
ncbi:cytochrome P450 [Artomyces pyxidatus]|uniref:Cytochrome P450 n=1 Tax=Artomyces pyxidatus TaxID=48021 RepID=A0ACB8TDT1_9AGAM|nr:cytochrome P450 [Artomyces pyxidatus]